MTNDGKAGAMRSAWEIGGMILTGIATAAVIGAGLTAMWIIALSKLPWWLGLGAIAGMAIAPFQFACDILRIDRSDRGAITTRDETTAEDKATGD